MSSKLAKNISMALSTTARVRPAMRLQIVNRQLNTASNNSYRAVSRLNTLKSMATVRGAASSPRLRSAASSFVAFGKSASLYSNYCTMAENQNAEQAPAAATSSVGQRLYVGNMSYQTKLSGLKAHMKAAGNVISADIILDDRGRSKGCGVVEYETAAQAQKAIASLHDTMLDGRKIFVREDREASRYTSVDVAGRKLFVGNLPYTFKWQQLKDLFGGAGTVIRANIVQDSDGRSKGSGTVLFETKEAAQKAIEMFNEHEISGRKLFVREDQYASKPQER